MSDDKEDVYEELRKTLDSEKAAKEEEPVVPEKEDPKPSVDDKTKEPVKEEKPAEDLKPEAEKAVKPPESPKEEDKTPGFKNVKEFLAAVQDEPSRNLLEKFYGVIKAETSETLAPIEQKNNEAKFEAEFSKYEKVEGLADYKNDLRKTFMRNPSQSLKALIGETLADLSISKVKPIETTPATPKRDGSVDLDKLSKDDLYAQLETMKE